ncbi:Transcriptional regulator [uncultured Gammaproteobacteria bacterium]
MLRVSRRALFAIEAVLDIAYHAGDKPVRSGEITERQDIPKRYLEPVLQLLVRAGVLAGTRGPRGGYRLARERGRITVGEIARIAGSLETNEDPIADAAGSPLGHLVVRPLWREVLGDCMTRLDAVTIDDLCRRARVAGIASEPRAPLDFCI